jgi:hypothetical protein
MKEFIGGRNYIGLQQPKEAEAFVIGVPCAYWGRLHGYVVRGHLDYSSNPAYTALLPVSVKTVALALLLEEKPHLMNTSLTRRIAENTPASTDA